MDNEIKEQIKSINNAITELKKMYESKDTSLKDMLKIADYARLLDITDFSNTICGF